MGNMFHNKRQAVSSTTKEKLLVLQQKTGNMFHNKRQAICFTTKYRQYALQQETGQHVLQ